VSRTTETGGFVADGRSRCLASAEFRRRREDLVRCLWQDYEERLHHAGLPAKVLLWVHARLEIRRKPRDLKSELAPRHGLY